MFVLFSRGTRGVSRDMKYFVLAVATFSFGGSVCESIFNNFLNDTFALSNFQRAMLEIPRELPGVLVALVSALFFFLPSRRLAVLAGVLAFFGLTLLGLASFSYLVMLPWLFLYSMGQHIFMPLQSSIGMEMAAKGQDGRRLGQLNAVRNASVVLGSFTVFLGFRFLRFNFTVSFLLAAACMLATAVLLWRMSPGAATPPRLSLKFHREYRLYYWLCVLFGTRKQIFLTFAPWVLVTVFHQPTRTIAWLLTIGGVVGIITQPLVGWAIDHLGERTILGWEAGSLIFVCLGYAFAGNLFSPDIAFIVAAACYVVDQTLMSAGIARATYLKKIARDPSHVAPTLAMAVSVDHVFSIALALCGGLLWNALGYQAVFICGSAIALINLFSTRRIRVSA